MAHSDSTGAVVLAIGANAFITVAKGCAWFFTGSGAMLAETIHSLVDTLNQCMLLVGEKRSVLAPTRKHPFGFGPEASFWGLLAAIGILVFGGGISIQHGLHALSHPEVPDNLMLALGVLALSTVIEAGVLVSVVKSLARTRGTNTWRAHLAKQGPGIMTVLLEDLAAVLGCIIATVALALCHTTGDGIYDAIAQLVIGGMLAGVGLHLVWRNRGMLVGQAIDEEELSRLRVALEDLDGIDRVTNLKTRQLSAHTFTMKAEVIFCGGELAQRLIPEFKDRFEEPSRCAEQLGRFADKLMLEQAQLVDRLEEEIREHFPGATYIALEPHVRDI